MYEIIWYCLDLITSGSYRKIRYWYNRINNQLFIYFQAVGTRVGGLVYGAVSIYHQLIIMCFTKYCTWLVSIVKINELSPTDQCQ